jgi:hypothetical protein
MTVKKKSTVIGEEKEEKGRQKEKFYRTPGQLVNSNSGRRSYKYRFFLNLPPLHFIFASS